MTLSSATKIITKHISKHKSYNTIIW